jgi:hypothetical protein
MMEAPQFWFDQRQHSKWTPFQRKAKGVHIPGMDRMGFWLPVELHRDLRVQKE